MKFHSMPLPRKAGRPASWTTTRSGFLARLGVVGCKMEVDLREIQTTGSYLNQGDI